MIIFPIQLVRLDGGAKNISPLHGQLLYCCGSSPGGHNIILHHSFRVNILDLPI
jgi:hypothetical protein